MISAPLGILSAAPGEAIKSSPITLQGLRVEDNLLKCSAGAIELQLNPKSQAPLQVLRDHITQCSRSASS